MEYSQNILRLIKARNISPRQLSLATGVSEATFSVWLKKPTSKMYAEALVKIADFLDVSLDYLIGRTDDDTPMSHFSNFTKTFCGMLGQMLPSFDPVEMEAVGIDINDYYDIATLKKN